MNQSRRIKNANAINSLASIISSIVFVNGLESCVYNKSVRASINECIEVAALDNCGKLLGSLITLSFYLSVNIGFWLLCESSRDRNP